MVNFSDVNSASFLEIGKFRFIRLVSGFSAHFLLPAWAGQLAHLGGQFLSPKSPDLVEIFRFAKVGQLAGPGRQ